MQINSIIQPVEVQSVELKLTDAPPIERVEKSKTETPAVPSQEKVEQSEKFKELQNALAEHNISLSFTHDDETNEIVVRMIDEKTGEAVNQFPSEVSLKLTAVFAKLQGQFVDEKV